MRPIIFRGKLKDKEQADFFNDWWRGDLIHHNDRSVWIRQQETGQELEVIPETVGQMWIVSRNTVFGGDLFTAECAVSGSKDKAIRVCKVEECNEGFDVAIWFEGEWWAYGSMNFTTMKIIGNIHDNPELTSLQCKKHRLKWN